MPKGNLPEYPSDHAVGVVVPKGGSDCAKCKYVSADETKCSQKSFVEWNGGEKLPAAADEYCCDFFEARTVARGAKELRKQK